MKARRRSPKTPDIRALRQSTITTAMSRRTLANFKKFVSAGIRRLEAGQPTFMFVILEENPGGRRRRTRATAVGGPPWRNPVEE